MREILFRGQTRKKGQKVWMDGSPVDGQWVYGGVLQGIGDFSVIYGGKNANDPSEGLEKWCVYTDTLGQYTGLTDKNGKKIFEGDIVRYMNKETMVVSWRNESASFVGTYSAVNFNYCATLMSANIYLEVIGNIHDNPELLRSE